MRTKLALFGNNGQWEMWLDDRLERSSVAIAISSTRQAAIDEAITELRARLVELDDLARQTRKDLAHANSPRT